MGCLKRKVWRDPRKKMGFRIGQKCTRKTQCSSPLEQRLMFRIHETASRLAARRTTRALPALEPGPFRLGANARLCDTAALSWCGFPIFMNWPFHSGRRWLGMAFVGGSEDGACAESGETSLSYSRPPRQQEWNKTSYACITDFGRCTSRAPPFVHYAYFEVASPNGHTGLDFINALFQNIQALPERGHRATASIFSKRVEKKYSLSKCLGYY
jgi:hypothetical protein